MKGIIIYKGKYGATQQYAHWLAHATGLNALSSSEISGSELRSYDYFVIGSSVYIGKLQIRKWLKRNLSYLTGKKIFLFQVAGTPPEEKEKRSQYNQSAPKEIMDNCECYFLHGKMSIKDLSWPDRFMLKMGARLAKDPADKKAMLTDYNDVRTEHLTSIIHAINNYSQNK